MTSKLTREQLIEKLKHRIAVAEKYPNVEEAQIDLQIFKLALAALDSEPQLHIKEQPAPVVPDNLLSMAASAIEDLLEHTDPSTSYYSWVWADVPGKLRAAMLNHSTGSDSANSPVIPDGYVLVPKKLTAENGAKALLSGEFSETKYINCPECFGDDECETCDGSGQIGINVPVTWTTIKAIWAKGVEHLAAAPQEVTSARVHPARDE